jgi:hypothetical protein
MAASKSVVLAAFICAACVANGSTDARAQARIELTPTTEIPRSYKSWSLFLICNPAWIVENGDKGIEELFHRYKAFGESIGPNNLAIWFWKKPAVTPTSDNTDISRSEVYCEKYKLPPSITVVSFCWHICLISESMGHHDSEIMDDRSID